MSVFGYPTENTNGTYKHANTTAELDMGLATSTKQWVDSEDIRRETDTRLTVSNENVSTKRHRQVLFAKLISQTRI